MPGARAAGIGGTGCGSWLSRAVLTPGGDVLHVGQGVLDPPLLRAQNDAVEVGINDG